MAPAYEITITHRRGIWHRIAVPVVYCVSRNCVYHLIPYGLRQPAEEVRFRTYESKRPTCTLNEKRKYIDYHVRRTLIICQTYTRSHRSQYLSRFPGERGN